MLTRIQEDYVQDIAAIISKKGYARVTDIARELEVKPASVTSMLNKLKERGLVKYEKHAPVFLTVQGQEIASKVQQKHSIFEKFLVTIGVPKHLAKRDALKIEHNVHPETIRRMQAFINHCDRHEMTCGFHCPRR